MRYFKIAIIGFTISAMIIPLFGLSFMTNLAYCQEKAETRQIMTIVGSASKVDAVGNIIEVETTGGPMAFTVPTDASITEGTKKIGLMEIEASDPVTIQYYSPSPGKFVVISITCNKNS